MHRRYVIVSCQVRERERTSEHWTHSPNLTSKAREPRLKPRHVVPREREGKGESNVTLIAIRRMSLQTAAPQQTPLIRPSILHTHTNTKTNASTH